MCIWGRSVGPEHLENRPIMLDHQACRLLKARLAHGPSQTAGAEGADWAVPVGRSCGHTRWPL